MDMVFHSVDAIQNAFSFRDYSPDILIQSFLLVYRDSVFSVMGAEDDVIEYLTIAVHDLIILGNPYRVMFSFMPNLPRLKPRVIVGQLLRSFIVGQLLRSWFSARCTGVIVGQLLTESGYWGVL